MGILEMIGRLGKWVMITLVLLSSSAYAQPSPIKNNLSPIKNNLNGSQTLLNHVPRQVALGAAKKIAPSISSQTLDLRVILPSKDPAGLAAFIKDVYDPKSPNFHKFLTPAQFAQRFGASVVDTALVTEQLRSQSLTVVSQSQNGFLLKVTGKVSAIESAFKVNINNYQGVDGKPFFSLDTNPTIATQIAGKVRAIIGLDNMVRFRPHNHKKQASGLQKSNSLLLSGPMGTAVSKASTAKGFSGPYGSIIPSNILTAYNLNGLNQQTINGHPINGYGQTLALFEMDGYLPSDVTAYEQQFGLPAVPLTNICTDEPVNTPCAATPGNGTDEVVMDIDLAIGTAPGLSGILVYETSLTDAGWSDQWNRIAQDDAANTISVSWGFPEQGWTGDDQFFQQMAAQGQTVFVAAGDAGAYDNCYGSDYPSSCTDGNGNDITPVLSPDHPASDPYVTGVGITALTTDGGGGWQSETASSNGGGGVSTDWTIANWPVTDYQTTLASQAPGAAKVSTTSRNVPDVALTADPNTYYTVYVTNPTTQVGAWGYYWGSSIASPIWAAYMSYINQGRVAAGQSTIGFLNPVIYQVFALNRSVCAAHANLCDFHDITQGNNGMVSSSYPGYPAEAGYDAVTGLGSFNGANLYADLIGPAAPTGLSATPSNGQVTLNWTASAGSVSYYNVKSSTSSTGPFTVISTANAVTGSSYTDNGPFTSGTTYYYVVSAVNTVGVEGANSTSPASATLTAPSISTPPSDQTVTAPATASFTVVASGTATLAYQWKYSTNGGTSYQNVTTGSGGTTATYTTGATSIADNGTLYECVVSNGVSPAVTSGTATLTVNAAPAITTPPSDQTVTAPATASFTVAASGTATLTYQWKYSTNGGTSYQDVSTGSGGTSATYTTGATSSTDSGTLYECVVSNGYGSVTSSAATLTVNVAPSITTPPSDQTVTAPATAGFTVAASGTGTLTYQWKYSTNGGTSYQNVTTGSGGSTTTYTTGATSIADNGTLYECVVSNGVSPAATSSVATLTVNAAPAITTPPSDQTVTAPATASFTVLATGTATLAYQWKYSTDGGTNYQNVSTGSGGTSATYTTGATTTADTGTLYECLVSNGYGSVTSNPVSLTVTAAPVAPSITTPPSDQTVTAPATASFTVAASGTAPLVYQWKYSTNGGTSYQNVSTGSGGTTATYTTGATSLADNGTLYECMVSNGTSPAATSSAATLTVNAAPAITMPPSNQTVTAPATASFTVAASGSATLAYQWKYSTNGGTSYQNVSTGSGDTTATYTTGATITADSGTLYECVVSNGFGSATSNSASLTVNATPVAPSITTPPSDQTVTAPATASFTVAASGTAPLVYQWKYSTNGGTSYQNVTTGSGGTTATYTTGATSLANNGTLFECVVSNGVSPAATSGTATLTVNAAPSITASPSNQTVTAPATASFTVVATGTATLTYQWKYSTDGGTSYQNVSTGSGATSTTYTTGATATANSGTRYECVVSNGYGSVTSNSSTLTVLSTAIAPPSALKASILVARVAGHLIYGATTLTWTQSTASGVTQNKIYRAIGSGTYSLYATINATNTYTDKSTTRGTTYHYEVTALTSSGESSSSNLGTVTYP